MTGKPKNYDYTSTQRQKKYYDRRKVDPDKRIFKRVVTADEYKKLEKYLAKLRG